MANSQTEHDPSPAPGTGPSPAGPGGQDDISAPGRAQSLDDLVELWGEDSFPASDPPGCLPPSMIV